MTKAEQAAYRQLTKELNFAGRSVRPKKISPLLVLGLVFALPFALQLTLVDLLNERGSHDDL